jgi:hypothetical protein
MKASRARFLVATLLVGGVVAWLVASATHKATPRPAGGVPPEATLYAQNLSLSSGAAQALRIAFDSARFGGTEPSARVIATTKPDTATVVACPLPSLDARIPAVRGCQTLASGVREVVGARGMRALAIVLLSPSAARADVVLSFDEVSRHVAVKLPFVPGDAARAECKDNACNPFFEVRPTRNGSFEASATWTGGGAATLVMFQGSVLGHSASATGLPYLEAARANGPPPLRVTGQMTAPGEYALALRQDSGAGLHDVLIDARWP